MEEEIIEEPWYKGPIKWIISLFLILLIILWFIPAYGVKIDPRPSYIPTIDEVVVSKIEVDETHHNSISLELVKGSDPVIKEIADKIVVKACQNGGRVCHSKALFYFVRDNFNYVSDPTEYEYIKTAKESLVSGGGDCDDASVLLANLLDAVGIETRFVFIPRHVYLEGYLPEALNRYKTQSWVVLDATCKNCGFGEMPYQNQNKRKTYLG
ncbi:hypothetical protein CEE44_00925 [Candidatus Woesearchaeota archaeon B3_Woes]|nr:MAG: hypothetical protein CEE44_00925 [Candidatus Woesearchaeota archaeon B3_Woes]